MADLSREALIQKWEEILEENNYAQTIREIADVYPEKRSLCVSYNHIEYLDADMAAMLLTNPDTVLGAGKRAIANMVPPTEEGVDIHLRITEIPKGLRVEIRDIRSKHLGNFISVEGLVKRATEVRPRMLRSVFKCARCNHETHMIQEEAIMHEPLECSKEEGGCGRARGSTRFIPVIEKSSFIDTQKTEFQERPEELRGGAQPQYLSAIIEDDLTGSIFPGDRIVINGILKSRMKRSGQNQMTLFDIYIQVNNIELLEADYSDVEITEEDMQQIEELSKDDDIYRKLTQSISPTIYGLEIEKEALVLQLFGGVPKEMPDGTKIRGDIHILLIGDPGTAKSQLLSYMADVTPRGVYASGKSSTGAGLTAAAVKDDFGEGRWTLEAGALVLADKGLACVDELDKMSPQDRSSMHEAMEQQRISVAKAGITATLQSRCSVLGAANPKFGRFDDQDYIFTQINLPPTLLSRFDMIFPLTDKPDSGTDSRIASHILRSHKVGEMKLRAEDEEREFEMPEDFQSMMDSMMPSINQELLRKYVFMAKRIYPLMTDEAIDRLRDYYLEIRKKGEAEEASVPITARQLEAFVRLAEASARGRMSDRVTVDDAERAIRISREFFRRVLGRGNYDGWDADVISTGVPKAQRDKIREIKKLMSDLIHQDPDGFTEKELIEAAEVQGFGETEVKKLLEKMSTMGEIYYGTVGGKRRYKLYTEYHEL